MSFIFAMGFGFGSDSRLVQINTFMSLFPYDEMRNLRDDINLS